MRPQLLVMEGFGAFRDRVEIDFDGVDFFALVGPTGSGKSTVIDAICFALYGSVPRYNDERLVAPTISTGASEARVSLRFTAGGATYSATRIARRTAKGATTKEARLEQHAADGTTITMAANATEIGEAVPALLGLTFTHFTRCVVLPQGEFAKFLHDKPGDRQDVLVKLLELDVYRNMLKEANARAAAATAEQAVVTARIEELGDLSDATLAAAVARRGTLDALRQWVEGVNQTITTIRTEESAARDELEMISAQIELLHALRMPAEVGELATRLAAAAAAVESAAAALRDADATVDTTRAAVAALPTRDALDGALRDHDDLAKVTAQLRTLTSEITEAAQTVTTAAEAVAASEAAIATAKATLEPIHELQAAAAAHDELLTLDARLAANTTATERAVAAHDAASERIDALQQELDQLTPLAATASLLQQIVTAHRDLAAAVVALERVEAEAIAADANVGAAAEELGAAVRERARAEQALAALQRAHAAAALAANLHVGDECPVCHHEITSLDGHEIGVDVNDVSASLDAAKRSEAKAQQAHSTALGTAAQAQARATAQREQHAAITASLATLASELDPTLATDNSAAVSLLRAAEDAQRNTARLTAERATVEAELNSCDVTLAKLNSEAATLGERRSTLVVVVAAHPDPAQLAARIERARNTAAEIERLELSLANQRTTESNARTKHAGLEAKATTLTTQQQTLAHRCTTHPSVDEARDQLAAVTAAEAAQHAALQRATDAKRAYDRSLAAHDACVRQEREARTSFLAARDTVASLAPPPTSDRPLLDEWTSLLSWSASQRASCESRAASINTTRAKLTTELATKLDERATRVGTDLAQPLPPDASDVVVDRAITGAINNVTQEIDRIEVGRKRTATLRAKEAQLREAAEVARKLGQLLSAKQFEQWLVSTALASLTSAASEILERLSGNEFGLESTEGNDFVVIDHHNADERRPVRSLSGGETFQASLALALALSQELGGLTAQPGRSLDSIFLDEGFGTLDPDTLETVASTIESLGHDGRMVGLITHVRELAERVPVRYRVTKGERTSTVVLDGAS